MRLESPPIPTTQKHENLSEVELKTFDLIVPEHEKGAINIEGFTKVPGYGKDRIKQARDRIDKKRKWIGEHGTEPTQRAKLLEAVLTNQIELNNWFGQNTYTIIPAEYDDLFHGVDLALEIEDDEKGVKYLASGIDVTSSPLGISKKLSIIKQHIRDGSLTMIEYFHSDEHNPDFYGVMTNIPHVVIGTSKQTIQDLSELWMTAYGLAKIRKKSAPLPLSPETEENQRKNAKEAIEKLARHRVQILLLEEMRVQLVVFHDFAKKVNQTEVADKFASVLSLVNSILADKEEQTINDVGKNSEDSVFQSLVEALKDFENL